MMKPFAPRSDTSPHHSMTALGFGISAGVLLLLFCMASAYIHYKGGPTEMLRARRERLIAKAKARDIEMAQAEDRADRVAVQEYKQRMAQHKNQEEEKEARKTIKAVTMANGLVGSVVIPPQRVDLKESPGKQKDFDEDLYAQRIKQLCFQQGKMVKKNLLDLSVEPAVDPMSFTMGRGKEMAALYREQ
ncbi:hypothetical protein N0V86_006580 [Didymella sp. IMI 355093]|nr:hypothetical protein N0V86_006580 [Didymella sp. IMI 355093]